MKGTRYELVRDLTDPQIRGGDALDALRRFATEFGWRPSDQLDRYAGTDTFCNGHLIVEHGFDVTSVISFLRSDVPYFDLPLAERRMLLELSYNNLVDWHLLPERTGMRVVFNRSDPPVDRFFPAVASDDVWRADAFERLTGERPNPNVKALDDALVEAVSFWKRAIRTDLGQAAGLQEISALINCVILVRALEDYRNRHQRTDAQLMTSLLDEEPSRRIKAAELITQAFLRLDVTSVPPWLEAIRRSLTAFDHWKGEPLREFIKDFYQSRFSPYRYNFHLISKHALSRIYEHYVAILRDSGASEFLLFRDLPEEVHNKNLGSIYTPQYIPRFFARYLKEHRTPREFRLLRSLDPACGSGMFLRTLLEKQCDPTDEGWTSDIVREAFSRAYGIDIDPNACQASLLSLAVLHLILTGEFPHSLNIDIAEAIEHLQTAGDEAFDVILTNPPFVKWDELSPAVRTRVAAYMLQQGFGKQDLYLAFLKAAMDHCAQNGAVCFVLPHSFLLSKSAAPMRSRLGEQFAVRILADLSEVPVFEQTGAYVVLLIAERTSDRAAPAVVVKCRNSVHSALQDALAGRTNKTENYRVFETAQEVFRRDRWILLDPEASALRDAIARHPRLETFVEVLQGVVTGDDEVFIRPLKECPKAERQVWKPLLSDREMLRFRVPSRPTLAVFMPFGSDGAKLTEKGLQHDYPDTWSYLSKFKSTLAARSMLKRYNRRWWEPAWPRLPKRVFVPKIVTPHLVLLPRFGVDADGKYAVSRSPYLIPRVAAGSQALLKIICAVLNSAVGHWQLASASHRYSRGYLMLEVKTLRELHVPAPAFLSTKLTRRIVQLADRLTEIPSDVDATAEIDNLSAEVYGLTKEQKALVGIEQG